MEEDNGDNYDGDWDNSDYLGAQPLSRVNFASNDRNNSPIERECGDTDDRNTDVKPGFIRQIVVRPTLIAIRSGGDIAMCLNCSRRRNLPDGTKGR